MQTDIFNHPIDFARTLLWIKDKEKNRIKLNYNPIQRNYLANRSRLDIVLKPRQKGFSTMIQAEIFRVVSTRRATGLTLGVDDMNTQHLRSIFNYYYDNLPSGLKPEKHFDNRTKISFPEIESEVIIMTAGSKGAGRGNTYTHIHASEVAFWNNAEDLLAGAMQGGNPSIVLESTPNGAQGFFYEKCMEAREGKSVWKLHFYRWFDDDEYQLPLDQEEYLVYDDEELRLQAEHNVTDEQLKWRRFKIQEIGYRKFIQEYPEDIDTCFLLSGLSYFSDIPHLKECFTAEYGDKPIEGHSYVAGLDLGRNKDYTALSIIDVNTGHEVDFLRINQMSWQEIRNRIFDKLKHWHVEYLTIEINNVGSVIHELLLDELEEMGDFGDDLLVHPFTMSNKSKSDVVNLLHKDLDDRAINFLKIENDVGFDVGFKEMNQFVAKQTASGLWTYQADNEGHDDTVIARALSNYSRNMCTINLLAFI